MAEKKFYIQRYLKSEQGAWKADGLRKSLEDDFGGGSVRYKSLDGLNSKGKQKGVYTESYPENDALRVFVEYLQDALRAADRRVTLVTSRRESIGAHGWGDVDARHRLACLRR